MELVLIDSAEIAVVRRQKDGVCDLLADKGGYSFHHRFLHPYQCKAESVLSVRFLAGVVLSNFWGNGD